MGKQAAYNIIMSETGSSDRKSYKDHINILCIMDTGNGAAFVFRNGKTGFFDSDAMVRTFGKTGLGAICSADKKRYYSKISGIIILWIVQIANLKPAENPKAAV